MKIMVFGARVDEIPYLRQWAKTHAIALTIRPELLNAETVALAAGYDGLNCLQTTPYSAQLFAKMGQLGIKYLTIRNVGTDNIDFAAAARAGVKIANTPAYSPNAIAEFAVTLTLNLLRQLGAVAAALRAGDYPKATTFIGRELAQQTVGVIGAGRIGRAAIKLFAGFGARVLIYDPHPTPAPDLPGTYVSLPELFQQSDVIDLHVPGIAANTHLIDAQALAQMKSDALVINTARGNLIDTQALLTALKTGHLGGAGIDTFENESAALLALERDGYFHDPLWDDLAALDNVLLAPHIAYYTQTAVHNMVFYSLQYLVDFLTNGHTDTEVSAH
ncbi:D-2-hydroxyacid dehydrogenase [Lacticaseibacillus baoqingensis]|uniref:D-2-hydroxyacid dehydrogenase n=1 Tax=Lacticaseibacillus baoqingensis TaxID=2486013 RepID=A0ABW4E8S1_9LACO|nr:D-2-hydroxyacid dehydrogenase [Lacticaseibacillus baoqingensis]